MNNDHKQETIHFLIKNNKNFFMDIYGLYLSLHFQSLCQ
jgi:hypothetical protein